MSQYLIIDLAAPLVLGVRDDLGEALADCDEPDLFDAYEDERADLLEALGKGLYCPDIAVVDPAEGLLWAPNAGEIVRCWWDNFTGRWRRILEATA